MKSDSPAWLHESHPNYLRWKRSRDLSIERGQFVQSVVNQKNKSHGLKVLDLGSGEGGTAKVFSENNFVVSLDLSLIRLQRQKGMVIPKESSTEESVSYFKNGLLPSLEVTKINCINSNALQLPFANHSFDLIIIQDVIEHLTDVTDFYKEVIRVLKSNGTIYLSTPNKYSIFNFIADPHFGLPIVSVLKRESIKKYFLKYLRKNDFDRNDIAQLLSLKELIKLFQKDFEISLNTKFSVEELFNGNKGIVWSEFHLNLISFCRLINIDTLLIKIANDKFGFVNKYFTPTFYIVLKKL